MKTLVLLVCMLTSAVLAQEDKECLGGVCIGDNFQNIHGFKEGGLSEAKLTGLYYKEINIAGVDGILLIALCGDFIRYIGFSSYYAAGYNVEGMIKNSDNPLYEMKRDLQHILNGYDKMGYSKEDGFDLRKAYNNKKFSINLTKQMPDSQTKKIRIRVSNEIFCGFILDIREVGDCTAGLE